MQGLPFPIITYQVITGNYSIEEEKERQYAMDNFSALIQGHTGNKVLMDINQIIDQVAAEEKYSPEVVKTALQIIDRQRELVAV